MPMDQGPGWISPHKRNTPPAGYTRLAEGARCRCPKLWSDGAGGHYCCKAAELGIGMSFAPTKPIEYRVEKVADGYEIRKDGELIGFDPRRIDANGTALSLEQADRLAGREATHYPCFED